MSFSDLLALRFTQSFFLRVILNAIQLVCLLLRLSYNLSMNILYTKSQVLHSVMCVLFHMISHVLFHMNKITRRKQMNKKNKLFMHPTIRSSCREGNRLVKKAGDKRARARCPGIRDEQRCENVTTNSLWSPNVTFPLPVPDPAFNPNRFWFLLSLIFPACFIFSVHFFFPSAQFGSQTLQHQLCTPAVLSPPSSAFLFISSKGEKEENNRNEAS